MVKHFYQTFKSRKILLIVLSVIAIISFIGACGCDRDSAYEEVKINLVDVVDRDILYYNEEYDVSKILIKEDGVDYKISELFYFDKDFNRKDITFSGMKFTQTSPYDVSVVIEATKGKAIKRLLCELSINYNVNAVLKHFKTCWSDSGTVKTYNADSLYLKDNAEVSMKCRYVGSYNPAGDNGVNFGSITGGGAAKQFSVTDWSNAVVEFDMYNASDKDLEIGYQLMKKVDGKPTYKLKMLSEVKANSWGRVCWSLRAVGWDYDFIAEGGGVDIKVKVKGEPNGGNFNYTFYLCNIDIKNYDAARYPDLETRTEEEIEAALTPLDSIGRNLVNGTRTTNFQQYINTASEFVKEGEQSVRCVFGANPDNPFTSDSSTYHIDNGGLLFLTEHGFETVYDKFGAYDAEKRTYASDTERTYAGFWIKNTTGKKLTVNFNLRLWGMIGGKLTDVVVRGVSSINSLTDGLVIEANDTEWHYYEAELDNSKIPTPLNETPNPAIIRMALAAQIEGAEAGDTFYVDAFDIYHKGIKPTEPGDSDETDGKVFDEKDTFLVNWTRTSNFRQSDNADAGFIKSGEHSIKCMFGADPEKDNTSEAGAYKIDNGGLLFLTEVGYESVYDKFSAYDAEKRTYASDTERTYAGFWIKNTTGKKLTVNFNLRLWGTVNGELTGVVVRGVPAINSLTDGLVIESNDTEWHYYEAELDNSKFPTPLNETPNPAIIRMALAAQIENAADGDTFYIDSFDIYHGSRAR